MYRVRAFASGQAQPAVTILTPSAKTAFGALHDLMGQSELVAIYLERRCNPQGEKGQPVTSLARQGNTWVEPPRSREGE